MDSFNATFPHDSYLRSHASTFSLFLSTYYVEDDGFKAKSPNCLDFLRLSQVTDAPTKSTLKNNEFVSL